MVAILCQNQHFGKVLRILPSLPHGHLVQFLEEKQARACNPHSVYSLQGLHTLLQAYIWPLVIH